MILKNWKAWLVGMILIPVVLWTPAIILFRMGFAQAKTLPPSQLDVMPPMIKLAFAAAALAFIVSYAWLSWGLYFWKRYSAVYWAGVVVHGTVVATILSVLLFWSGRQPMGVAVAGFWLLTAAFFIGIWLVRGILSFSHPIFSIAKTVVDEALRMKVGLIFIVLILLVVPAFPIAQDFSERLQYRMQAFLTWSTLLVSVLLSFMSIFLGAWTVCSEVKNRQIYLSLSKPVRRFDYILGKWLGLIMLNLVLVIVAGGGIYVFARVLEVSPAKEQSDRDSIREQVLVARDASIPMPIGNNGFQEQIQKRIRELQASAAHLYGDERDGINKKVFDAAQTQVISEWLTVTPGNRATYVYRGLEKAKGLGGTLTLKMKPNLSPRPEDDLGMMLVMINGQLVTPPDRPIRVLTSTFQNFPISTEWIKSDKDPDPGSLELTLINITPPDGKSPVAPSITFSTTDGLELLYQVDTFENNLIRMLFIIWFRVVFLSIVGIMCGTFLTFPVAALLGSMILVVAYMSGFLLESLSAYASVAPNAQHDGNVLLQPFYALWEKIYALKFLDALKQCVRMFGEFFVFFIPSFSKHDPSPLIADGRVITWNMVGNAGLMIGLVWSGAVCLLAWIFFWLKELARVIV